MTKRITAIVGDFYHDEALARESLEKAFGAAASSGEWTLDFTGTDRILQVLEEDPAVIVLFKENRLNPQDEQVDLWMDGAVSAAIERYVQGGGAWLAWHAGLASYAEDSEYIRMLKGYFISHPPQNKEVRYIPVNTADTGWSAEGFQFLDEHYFVSCAEESTGVFLRSESEDGSSIGGWRHLHGEGKVCCLAPAHRREGLLAAPFLELLGNCLKWCAEPGKE